MRIIKKNIDLNFVISVDIACIIKENNKFYNFYLSTILIKNCL